jgi:hypothetical protein
MWSELVRQAQDPDQKDLTISIPDNDDVITAMNKPEHTLG